MKKLIIGNWKSNKSTQQAKEWIAQMTKHTWSSEEKEVILCPAFPLVSVIKHEAEQSGLSLALGVQDISPFDEGSYTGAVSAKLAAEFVTHGIVGHSERRKYFHETDDDVINKIKRLLESKITPILCISDIEQLTYYLAKDRTLVDNASKIIFVYEPPSAISGGGAFHPESPEVANQNASEISQKIGKKVTTLYGGSLNPENVSSFFIKEYIDGGLVGQASLDPEVFLALISNA